MNKIRATAGFGAATAMLALSWLVARPAEPPARADEPAPPIAPTTSAVGSVGCSGVACHGSPVAGLVPKSAWGSNEADNQRWRSSFTVWKCYDPHGRAFEILGNDRSRNIESRLSKPGETPLEAKADVRCLACHTNPTLAKSQSHPLLSEGVSCEACHGNAGPWISDHAGWPAGPGHAAKFGAMIHLSDPAIRAATCAGCHVGAPATAESPVRDVNHDLIAAGHPRLNFDYATYLRALPPHWAEKDRDRSPPVLAPPEDEFRHWLVGKAATTAARFRLLEDRAARGPWPELAESDCYACHHGLTDRGAGTGGRRGELAWNGPLLSKRLSGRDEVDLRTAMRRPGESAAICMAAHEAAEAWHEIAMQRTNLPIPRMWIAEELADVKPRRWDEACQLYYALLAIDRAADPSRSKPEDARFAELRMALRLPRESDGARFNSPKDFDPDRLPFAELFRERAK